jgi:hypothetical protein
MLLYFIVVCCLIAAQYASKLSPLQSSLKSGKARGSFNLSVVSWNMAEKAPNDKDCSFIREYRSTDFVVFGIQECEDIKPRRKDGHRTRKWSTLQKNLLGSSHRCVVRHKLGGLMLSVFAKRKLMKDIKGIQTIDVACGVGNVLTNKGATVAALRIRNKTIILANAHFAAHQTYVRMILLYCVVCSTLWIATSFPITPSFIVWSVLLFLFLCFISVVSLQFIHGRSPNEMPTSSALWVKLSCSCVPIGRRRKRRR